MKTNNYFMCADIYIKDTFTKIGTSDIIFEANSDYSLSAILDGARQQVLEEWKEHADNLSAAVVSFNKV